MLGMMLAGVASIEFRSLHAQAKDSNYFTPANLPELVLKAITADYLATDTAKTKHKKLAELVEVAKLEVKYSEKKLNWKVQSKKSKLESEEQKEITGLLKDLTKDILLLELKAASYTGKDEEIKKQLEGKQSLLLAADADPIAKEATADFGTTPPPAKQFTAATLKAEHISQALLTYFAGAGALDRATLNVSVDLDKATLEYTYSQTQPIWLVWRFPARTGATTAVVKDKAKKCLEAALGSQPTTIAGMAYPALLGADDLKAVLGHTDIQIIPAPDAPMIPMVPMIPSVPMVPSVPSMPYPSVGPGCPMRTT